MCLAQLQNAVTLESLKPATPQSRVKHSTTEPLRPLSLAMNVKSFITFNLQCYNSRKNLISMLINIFKKSMRRKISLYIKNSFPFF